MGLGCIRGLGETAGTLRVQFDSGGSTWVIKATDLQKEAPQKSFRLPGSTRAQSTKPEEKIARKVKKRGEQRLNRDDVLASRPDVTAASLKNLVLENNRAESHFQTSYG